MERIDVEKNSTIVIGCSSGPDSMALFDMLLKKREEYNLKLICAHVNHNLRTQSKEEAIFMKAFCKENDVLFEYLLIDNYGDDNFHNEARNIRYNFFEEVVKKYNADYLMTAHHGDDLIETILMRISRGSSLKGYSGFQKEVEKDGYKIVRPLIDMTKEDLLEYNRKNKVQYFIDSSNEKMKYTRNRYRANVLPFLKSEDPNIHLKYLKFSEDLDQAYQIVEREKQKVLKKVTKEDKIIIDLFKQVDPYFQKEILYSLINKFYEDDLILITDHHIDLIMKMLESKKANSYVDLPNDVIARKEYNLLEINRKNDEVFNYEIEYNKYVELPNGKVIKEGFDEGNSNDICRLCSKEINLPLIIRNRRIGDKMKVKGLNGSKKIKDIFIDKKINSKERDLWPVVVDSTNNVVWLPGLKKSKYDKKKDEEYDIILKYE
ncbi:MAG: tRNA lysidine(34) synthetase TilS [Bacilli bacterium]|nr:tRNA lysidine(34) synthetase TilS [Bacilli bacterium]